MAPVFRHDRDLDFTDLFCGGGGTTTGFTESGYTCRLAANHDPVSIRTHVANHPTVEHRRIDISNTNKRSMPRTRILAGSPICTEIALAGGRKRTRGQLELDLQVEGDEGRAKPETWERTRATALDMIAWAEVHRPDAVFVENVVEFATDWELFDWWLKGWHRLGYRHQIVCASSAHLGDDSNVLAPQLRDRIYIVFTRTATPKPNLEVRPAADCRECGPVRARQVWNNPRGRKIGKWGEQYNYRCPNRRCGHQLLIPHVRAVAEVIDWNLLGRRVGDGKPRHKVFKPYAASTRARIAVGLQRFGADPHIAMLRNNSTAVSIRGAVPVLAAQGRHHALIIPNGRKNAPRTTAEPLTTLATKPHHSLVWPAPEVDDCLIRMLTSDEMKQIQRFSPEYIVHGNLEERTLQIGNAVSVNAARWFAERIRAALTRFDLAV
ncbi:DNA cytosine methyltransferase [Kitasatospora sp. NPDC059146]|uniref:DNA cytosine methyltransferase n=1 Tax=unclassified Kitasatospora TaxID=2633591 RepID=UPI0036876FEB